MFTRKKLLLIVLLLTVVLIIGVVANQASAPGGIFDSATDETEEQPAQQGFDKSRYSTSNPASKWVIVNKNRPLNPLAYAPDDLVAADNGHQLRKEAADALDELFKTAKAEGYDLAALSAYRSYERQQIVYNREVRTYGQEVADTQSAKPGHSEHQTGLAVDVGGGGCGIEDCFGDTAEGKWVAANAYKYGFIIRYPEGKEDVTGYRYEPWHLRYVGVELSTEMHNQNVQTLEEFFDL